MAFLSKSLLARPTTLTTGQLSFESKFFEQKALYASRSDLPANRCHDGGRKTDDPTDPAIGQLQTDYDRFGGMV
jgi:hypothetical protein